MKIAAFGNRAARETDDEEVSKFDGPFNSARPILSWQKFFFVHPGLETRTLKGTIEFLYLGTIFSGIGEEDPRAIIRLEDDAIVIQFETAEAINLNRPLLAHAAIDHLQRLAAEDPLHGFTLAAPEIPEGLSSGLGAVFFGVRLKSFKSLYTSLSTSSAAWLRDRCDARANR